MNNHVTFLIGGRHPAALREGGQQARVPIGSGSQRPWSPGDA